MDDIQTRLENTVKACQESYAAWVANPGEASLREAVVEHSHELRRIAARLEIEMAVAESKSAKASPIPIPPHRAAGGAAGGASGRAAGRGQRRERGDERIVEKGVEKGAERSETATAEPVQDKPQEAGSARVKAPRSEKTLNLKPKTQTQEPPVEGGELDGEDTNQAE